MNFQDIKHDTSKECGCNRPIEVMSSNNHLILKQSNFTGASVLRFWGSTPEYAKENMYFQFLSVNLIEI